MSTAIKVENVSKLYRLGQIGTGSLSSDLKRFWHQIRGKEDPFSKIGETNDRAKKGNSNYVWSLKDLDFEIEQGDAVGIIGRNGAGKSTLLKLLSRVTSPTTGSIRARGRIASLLEVGTGFHPDLTGRENIFLNGAILGMRKHEIKKHFDAIVDFAGVERYIDTPVKRYSSGMYVRLAFAVAAHLESEILIVDEVLAVGDAEFQKKCLGKMGDVSSKEGRTVLFVSHDLNAIKNFCKTSIWLNNGLLETQGDTPLVINQYLSGMYDTSDNGSFDLTNIARKNTEALITVTKVEVFYNAKQTSNIPCFEPFEVHITLDSKKEISNPKISLVLKDLTNKKIVGWRLDEGSELTSLILKEGSNKIVIEVDALTLLPNRFKFSIGIVARNALQDIIEDFGNLEFYLTGETNHVKHTDLLISSKAKWRLDN